MPANVTSLQLANSALRKEIRALKSEINRLQDRNAKLEAEAVSLRGRVKALERLKAPPAKKPVDENEAARRIAFVLNRGGYAFVDGKAVKVKDSHAEGRAKRGE